MKESQPLEQTRLRPGEEWLDAAPNWRFLRLTTGSAYWLGAPGPRSLVESEILVIPPGVRALIRASQLSEVLLHSLSLSPVLLAQLFAVDERQLLQAGGANPSAARFLPSTHPAAQRFAELVAHHGGCGGISERAEAIGIAAEVFDAPSERRRPPPAPSTSVRQRFEQLVAPMPEAELIHYTAARLARMCGCSPRHFNRLFRTRSGASFRARQTELRLLKARDLLAASNSKIREVALESGYRNLGLFNSLFRRRFGVTPSQWRQTNPPQGQSARASAET